MRERNQMPSLETGRPIGELAAPQPSVFDWLIRLTRRSEIGIFLALVALVLLITANDLIRVGELRFATKGNLQIVSAQVAYVAIVALGVFFVILTSGIDLSIGSIVGLSGIVCGFAITARIPWLLAIPVGLAAGALIGSINGAIVAWVGVAPFIVTLAMLGMARGLIFILTRGDSIRGIPQEFIAFGQADVFGIPMPVLVLVAIAIASHIVLTYTVFGRRIYALGGNEKATELSGINVRRVKFLTYVVSAVLSSVTGILYVARFRSAQANSGLGMELDAIAAAVIGGASLMGGAGTVIGVLIGAMIMGVIRNGLVLMRVSSYWQDFIIGLVILVAAVIDVLRNRRRA
jgi:ribose/xylose/arabinose/galactoside ABC-type transport system permease subunit